jgi:hypothetical protein
MRVATNVAHLFSMRPPYGFVTMHDVAEAYEQVRSVPNISSMTREAIYHSYGLDADRVERLYPIMKTLETSWSIEPPLPTCQAPWLQIRLHHVLLCFFAKWVIKIYWLKNLP